MAKFSSEVINLAQQTETKYGVPASVTLAQYAVESGYGKSGLATKANNYFGITGKNYSTGKYVVMNGRSWASYNSMAESFDDHGRLLTTSRYANAHQNTTNAYQYVDAIAEIYAPSSDGNNGYAALVKQVISDNNLTQYDKAGVSAPSGGVVSGGVSGGSTGGGSVVQADTEFLGVDWGTILGKIIKFLTLFIVGVMAAVFFFNAFDFDARKLIDKAKPKPKVKKKEGGEDGG